VEFERIANCPFSLSIEATPGIFPLLERSGNGVRVPFEVHVPPLSGALSRTVSVKFHRRPDTTEPGRAHDEVAFDWNARSRWLPNMHGVIRFRAASSKTRIILHAEYIPPIGQVGVLFDRAIGQRLARATALDLLNRLSRRLEDRWAAERVASPAAAP
jgi:hypothetical protein